MAIRRNGYKPKQRNSGSRKRKPIIFMIAEGKNKTESLYFKDFSQDVNRVIRLAAGNHTDPVHMVVELRSALEENDFNPELGDKAYCLIDSDVASKKDKQIETADKLASKSGIEVIVSSPCFEIWFLAHYFFSTKKYTSNDEIIADLQKYIKGYKKGSVGMYRLTKESIDTAISNAKKMELFCQKNGYDRHTVQFSPSTEIYKVVEELIKENQ